PAEPVRDRIDASHGDHAVLIHPAAEPHIRRGAPLEPQHLAGSVPNDEPATTSLADDLGHMGLMGQTSWEASSLTPAPGRGARTPRRRDRGSTDAEIDGFRRESPPNDADSFAF